MNFAWPQLLWLLVLPAALLVRELVRIRRSNGVEHPKILRAEAGLRSVNLSGDNARSTSARRRFLLCAGLALGVLAIARPRWGRIDEPVFDQSREIIIALDLSRSMLTPDVKPTRLDRSKLLIQSLLDKLKGERVGLVVFSGTAFLQAPLSADYEILREFLPTLSPDFLPEGGTNYRQLIDASIEAFGDSAAADRYLIILSDGEATDDDWRDRVPELEKKGIRVIGLGVGTSSGGMIPDGAGAFMKDDNGAVVLSKLESGTLKELAEASHGVYRDASDWVDLSKVLASTVDQGRKGRFVEQSSVRYVERYQWALAQALVCLVASFWLEFPVRPKSREIRLSPPAPPKVPPARTVALACVALLLVLAARAAPPPPTITAEAPQKPAAGLAKVVGRLSVADQRKPVDWEELGNETLTWGEHLKSSNQKVPEGPVRDALAGVQIGEKADPKVTDWAHMRSELEELLKKPDEPQQKKDQQQNQQQDQKRDQKQDQKKDQQQDQKDSQQQKEQGKPQDKDEPRKDPQQKPADSKQPEQQSAFGDMNKAPTPTPPHKESQEAMQKVGGVRKKEDEDPARKNPELAVPLEKLEQLKADDSPAELFEMMRRGEPIPTPTNTGKNW
jgi:Ca-activated chloride channel family protein